MARGKAKKAELSIEEKLQQALVPVDEQPYEVPDNWCWVYAPFVFNIEYGKGLPTKKLCADGYNVFGANGQIGFFTEYMFEESKALMSCRGAYSGTMNLSLPKSFVTNNSLIIDSRIKNTDVKFVFYLYSALNKEKLISGSAQPQVTVQSFANYPVPLPPLPEQQRIVERIESLFAKLDEVKEKLEAVVDSYETRKAAILHKAFTGELTKKWREENGVSEYSWKEGFLRDIVSSVKDKVEPTDEQYAGLPYIGLEHMSKGVGIIGNGSIEDAKSTKNHFKKGDILYGKLRPYLDKHDITDCEGVCSTDILVYRASCDITASYVNYLFGTIAFMEYAMSTATGINLPRTSEKSVSAFRIKYPTIAEQEEIVRVLSFALDNEVRTIRSVEFCLNNIDLLKKSILARAFRGELGTNIPDESSSIELLKEALMEND